MRGGGKRKRCKHDGDAGPDHQGKFRCHQCNKWLTFRQAVERVRAAQQQPGAASKVRE